MKIRYQKKFPVLLFSLLVFVSTLVFLPQAESAITGVQDVYREQDFGLHILRKAMLVSLASQQGAENPGGWNGRISERGRLVRRTQGSPLAACCVTYRNDRRQSAGIR
jgi:hypothetical protein